jgi:hypothetical protein
MPWWEICVTLVILRMVYVSRRSKRSGPDGRSFRPSSRSLQHTSQKQTLPELDPDRTAHDSLCRVCRARVPVPLAISRLERSPWRLTWQCQVCGSDAFVKVAAEALPVLLMMDRAGGMPLSRREADEFARVRASEFELAVREELL